MSIDQDLIHQHYDATKQFELWGSPEIIDSVLRATEERLRSRYGRGLYDYYFTLFKVYGNVAWWYSDGPYSTLEKALRQKAELQKDMGGFHQPINTVSLRDLIITQISPEIGAGGAAAGVLA